MHVFMENISDFQSKLLNELFALHTFIKTNEEDTNEDAERKLVSDVMTKFKE